MTFIFLASSRQNVSVSEIYFLDFLVLKSVHLVVYSILYILFCRALYSVPNRQEPYKKILQYAVLFSLIYAATDEIHQMYVPTRTGTLRDVLIDASAILVIYAYMQYNKKLITKLLTY